MSKKKIKLEIIYSRTEKKYIHKIFVITIIK